MAKLNHKRGDTFRKQWRVPLSFWTLLDSVNPVAAQIRDKSSEVEVADLIINVDGQDIDYTYFTTIASSTLTADWPIGTYFMDFQFKYLNGDIKSSSDLQIAITVDRTIL